MYMQCLVVKAHGALGHLKEHWVREMPLMVSGSRSSDMTDAW